MVAALLAEMDVRCSLCFENCETELRHSKCIRQGGVEAPVLWGRMAKYVSWKAEEQWKTTGWRVAFGGNLVQRYDVRRHLFICHSVTTERSVRAWYRHYRRVAGPGHGAQAGAVMVEEHL